MTKHDLDKKRKIWIYKIECKDPAILPFYLGTTSNFKARRAGHITALKKEKNPKHNYYLYQFIRDYGGANNWCFKIIHTEENKSLREAKQLEKEYIEMYKPLLNTYHGIRKIQEKQKDHIRISRIIARHKCLESHRKALLKSYHKHKEKRMKYQVKYLKENKEKIKERNNQKIYCLCGEEVRFNYRIKHRKGKKHKEKLKSIFNSNELFNKKIFIPTSEKIKCKNRTLKKQEKKNRCNNTRRKKNINRGDRL